MMKQKNLNKMPTEMLAKHLADINEKYPGSLVQDISMGTVSETDGTNISYFSFYFLLNDGTNNVFRIDVNKKTGEVFDSKLFIKS